MYWLRYNHTISTNQNIEKKQKSHIKNNTKGLQWSQQKRAIGLLTNNSNNSRATILFRRPCKICNNRYKWNKLYIIICIIKEWIFFYVWLLAIYRWNSLRVLNYLERFANENQIQINSWPLILTIKI